MSEETKRKMIETKSKNPTRYWLGKSRPKETYLKRKITMSKRKYPKASENFRLLWQDKGFREKQRISRAMKPNKAEISLYNIIERIYPGEYKYTGDFSFSIDGLSPDFVNCNGQKKIIELFGRYWHEKSKDRYRYTAKGRKEAFAKFGYTTLIIWDDELSNIKKLKEKLETFHNA